MSLLATSLALLNFLVLLGWWPDPSLKHQSGHPEVMSVDEMTSYFGLDRMQKASAVFDMQKLRWMNGFYIRNLDLAELAERARPFFIQADYPIEDRPLEWFQAVLNLVRNDVELLSELPAASAMFFEETPFVEEGAVELLKTEEVGPVLTTFLRLLQEGAGEISAEEVHALQKETGKLTAAKGKKLFMPIRALVTGRTHGPELKDILPLMGRERVEARIRDIKKQVGI